MRFRTFRKTQIKPRYSCRSKSSAMAFINFLFENDSIEKVHTPIYDEVFRNTKKAGRSKERAREKVGSLVGQRQCVFLPFVRITSPRLPSDSCPLANARSLVHVKICDMCACLLRACVRACV